MAVLRYAGPSIEKTAGGTLTAYRAVAVIADRVIHADKDTSSHAHNVRGIISESYVATDTVKIQTSHRIVNASWSWAADSLVYLGESGQLTQTKPSSGFILAIGTAESATEIYIDIGFPQDLNERHVHVQESFTLNATDITNKYVLLGSTPAKNTRVLVNVDGNGYQRNTSDYQMDAVNAKKVDWNGLGWDGLLVSGDVLTAHYEKESIYG